MLCCRLGAHASEPQEVSDVALTRDFKPTVADRVRRDPAFAKALLDEAATLFLNGEPHTARLVLRDLVNATMGFEALAAETAKPAKSLHRMLSKNGNPTMDNPPPSSARCASGWAWSFRLARSKRREGGTGVKNVSDPNNMTLSSPASCRRR